MYAALRFIAGIGLAGELGAGITLGGEVMPKNTQLRHDDCCRGRRFGCSAGINEMFDWRNAYFIGGGLGLTACAAHRCFGRMFSNIKDEKTNRGDFFSLLLTASDCG